MATKKTEKSTGKSAGAKTTKSTTRAAKGTKAAAAKAPAEKKVKAPPVKQGPRHPRGRLVAAHSSKEALAKALAPSLVRGSEDAAAVEAQLKTASNKQLLRLAAVTETVKQKWGSRDKLIAAIGTAQKKSKDKDFLAKLDTYSLPQLLDLAKSSERRARA
ncbi:MAG: hypothetical protein ACTHU0_07050 [Kofleriaceae bacterium]